MIIAVASGKGGTGKTTVAVNMALSARRPVRLLDCDVEAPNCHLFLRPKLRYGETLGVPVPRVDESKCTHCGRCAEVCQYRALAVVATEVLVFPELCHGCGGCLYACPTGAISESSREIGVLERGSSDGIEFVHGRLRVGEAMSPPLIRAVKRHATADRLNIVDAPPGTSCPVIAAVKDSDYVVLVTEPTPFGLHDLTLAVDTMRRIGVPCGVVINRSDIGDGRVVAYCVREALPILFELPHDRRIAEAYARGARIVEALPDLRPCFAGLLEAVVRAVDDASHDSRKGDHERCG